MFNIPDEFHLPSKYQTLEIAYDSLYCGEWKKFQSHAVTLTLV